LPLRAIVLLNDSGGTERAACADAQKRMLALPEAPLGLRAVDI
jgi:hypothetical protein